MKVFSINFKSDREDGTQISRPVGEHWFQSEIIQPDTIHDAEGGRGNEPTSIPSPFARMDLVRSALKYVAQVKEDRVYDGTQRPNTYFKIVSDFLDVAEIFFNYHRWKDTDLIKIVKWDIKSNLEALKNSSAEGHKLLAKSLSLYHRQDKTSFNFDLADKCFLLVYKNSEIIGGTSPKTLFFTSGNDLSTITELIFPNGDKPFDKELRPLHKRDHEFQKMVHSIFKKIKEKSHANRFKDLQDYLDTSKILLQNGTDTEKELWDSINNLPDDYYSHKEYDPIDGCFILADIPLLCAKEIDIIETESDFEIKMTKVSIRPKPLILKQGHSGKTSRGVHMKYYNAPYAENTKIPLYDSEHDLNKRKLPGLTNIKYPYLICDDFLEPFLIQTNFHVNDACFYSFVDNQTHDPVDFVLPLKRRFFDYYNIEDIIMRNDSIEQVIDPTKPELKIKYIGRSSAVEVSLSIPIKCGEKIEFKRYYVRDYIEPNVKEEKFKLITYDFTLGIFPFLKLTKENESFSRVIMASKIPINRAKTSLRFFHLNDGSPKSVDPKTVQPRSIEELNNAAISTDYYVIETNFDFIEISYTNGAQGIILPKTRTNTEGSNIAVFSVDLGTTNTHIEFSINGADPQPFNCTSSDRQLILFHKKPSSSKYKPSPFIETIDFYMLTEFLPETFGNKEDLYGFPMRTALGAKLNLNMNEAIYSWADVNIPFFYEKIHAPLVHIMPDLKWDNSPFFESKIEKFIENIIILIRNKALQNSCDLKKTDIIWFYPNSMSQAKRDQLKDIWDSLFRKYINNEGTPKSLSESEAPFYWVSDKEGVTAADKPVLSIDIGGETTDIVLYEAKDNKQVPSMVSSFRFAGNAVFGDGLNSSISQNGFINKFLPSIHKELSDKNLNELKELIDSIKTNARSSNNIIEALFSLEGIKKLSDEKKVSFNNILFRNNEFKIVFMLFFAAIMYHVAKLIKKTGKDFPRYITFTGNGSKILNIIDRDSKNNSILCEITQKFFEAASGDRLGKPAIKRWLNGKQITCKGGILFSRLENYKPENIRQLIRVYPGGDLDVISSGQLTDINSIKDTHLNKLTAELNDFLKEFQSLKPFLKECFDLQPSLTDDCINTIRDSAMEFLKLGILKRRNEEGDEINETLFFYPLIGGINKVAFDLSQRK